MKNFIKIILFSLITFHLFAWTIAQGISRSWDLIGVNVEEIHSSKSNGLVAATEDGKYGILSSSYIINFETNEINYFPLRFGGFITNRYISIADSAFGKTEVFDLNTEDIIVGEIFLEGIMSLEEIDTLYKEGHSFTISNSLIYIVEEQSVPVIIFLVEPRMLVDGESKRFSNQELKNRYPEANFFGSGACNPCLSPNGKFNMSREEVFGMDGEVVFTADDIKYINPFFNLNYITFFSWTADGNGIIATYGKSYLYKGFGYPYVEYRYRLPSRIIIIPFP